MSDDRATGNHPASDIDERDSQWSAPVLWRSEFRNLLAGYMRRGDLSLDKAMALQRAAEQLMDGREHESDSAAVLRLVHDSPCSACDCEFVALAQRLGVRLATADAKVRRAFPQVAVPLAAG